MAMITLRLDDRTRDYLDVVARRRGVTVSDLARQALDDHLGLDPTRTPSDAPLALTTVERCMLKMQHEILARLDANDSYEADHHRRMIKVLEQGFTSEYVTAFQDIRPELSHRDCSLVRDLLEMFRVLKISLERLSADEKASLDEYAEDALTFRGFDFNDEHEALLANYAEYLIDGGQWAALAEHFDDGHEGGNSHMPVLGSYQRMLGVFAPIWDRMVHDRSRGTDRYLLNTEELEVVYAGWRQPR